MALLQKHTRSALAALSLMLFLISCASYNRQVAYYYTGLENGDYVRATTALDKNRLLHKKRNHLLYLMEKGKLAFLQQQYAASNRYLNEADLIMEDVHTSGKDLVAGTLLNPMMETYQGEDFEKYMVYYYKALNYLALGEPGEALVEARRITLRSYAQEDKYKHKDTRYTDDAFSEALQGMIYESSGDVNNAFISYRNAVDIYLAHNGEYYGVPLPLQLEQDLLRTAWQNGFTDELERYEQLLNLSFEPPAAAPPGGELVLFWENGLAPVKQEQDLFFTLTKNGVGDFVFVDPAGSFNIPFDAGDQFNRDDIKLEDLRSFRVAIPRYEQRPVFYRSATIMLNGDSMAGFEKAEDINELAFATLRQRMVKELSKALSRLAVKKLAEVAARPKKDDKNKDEKEALALAIQVFSLASEKADTRNWQSLPHTIYYTRIPLQTGENQLKIVLQGPGSADKTYHFTVNGTGGMQFKSMASLH